MKRTQIKKGGIVSAGYDRAHRILEIEFEHRVINQYLAVPESTAMRLIKSSSPYSIFKDTIEEEFTEKKVPYVEGEIEEKKDNLDKLKALFGEK